MSALVLLLALLIAPEEAQKTGTAAKSASAVAATAAEPSKTIVGEIVWVDLPARLVLVRESVKSTAVKGKPATRETIALAVAPDVPVIRGKQPSTFALLKPKDHVVARYLPTPDGARAVSLRVADATTGAPRGASGTTPIPAGTAGDAN
ncbi:MAG: hypothetical protein NEA02_14115 [Thermoanaerobaculia bacterium]|nr:hypothetical protein [Thermoanaerobaculia bacterium]